MSDYSSIAGAGGGGGGVFQWLLVNSTSNPIQMAPNLGYVCDGPGQIIFVLPTVFGFGQVIRVVDLAGDGWKITQNAGQSIQMGNDLTTLGVPGFLQSTGTSDAVEMLGVVANIAFDVISAVGNITVS